jgi:hypothetical protein
MRPRLSLHIFPSKTAMRRESGRGEPTAPYLIFLLRVPWRPARLGGSNLFQAI